MLETDTSGNPIMAQDDQDGVWEILLRCAKEENSETLFRKALQLAESHHGKDSVQVGSVCGELARFYRNVGNDAAAEAHEERAEQILRSFVLDKPNLINNLIKKRKRMKKFED